jgi:hypothetical protein
MLPSTRLIDPVQILEVQNALAAAIVDINKAIATQAKNLDDATLDNLHNDCITLRLSSRTYHRVLKVHGFVFPQGNEHESNITITFEADECIVDPYIPSAQEWLDQYGTRAKQLSLVVIEERSRRSHHVMQALIQKLLARPCLFAYSTTNDMPHCIVDCGDKQAWEELLKNPEYAFYSRSFLSTYCKEIEFHKATGPMYIDLTPTPALATKEFVDIIAAHCLQHKSRKEELMNVCPELIGRVRKSAESRAAVRELDQPPKTEDIALLYAHGFFLSPNGVFRDGKYHHDYTIVKPTGAKKAYAIIEKDAFMPSAYERATAQQIAEIDEKKKANDFVETDKFKRAVAMIENASGTAEVFQFRLYCHIQLSGDFSEFGPKLLEVAAKIRYGKDVQAIRGGPDGVLLKVMNPV